jgi:AcrR family transcriptional regulator
MARKTGSHAETTGPRVRAAALRLFARHGYAAVSMRQIAREVGVQAGALYAYTPDKQSLLADLMRTHMDEVLAGWTAARAALPPGTAPTARLAAFVQFHIGFHLDRPEAVFVAYMELRNLEPENFAAIEALRRRYEDTLEAILRDGVALGEFRVADTTLCALALIAMLTGVNTWYREGGRLSRGDVAAQYWAMARRAVGAGC